MGNRNPLLSGLCSLGILDYLIKALDFCADSFYNKYTSTEIYFLNNETGYAFVCAWNEKEDK